MNLLKMNLVEEAARIAEARFAALATSVVGYDPITGALTWKNNKLTAGASVLVGYLWGTYDSATGAFSVWVFESGGVQYACGSVLTSAAPAQGGSKTDSIKSYAPNFTSKTMLDALCFIGTGTLSVFNQDYGSGARTIGLKWSDFQALSLIAVKAFEDMLEVSPWVAAAEITTFTATKA